MTKEKRERLTKYQFVIKQRLEGSIPEKHKDHPTQFKAYLNRELAVITAQLDADKLEMSIK